MTDTRQVSIWRNFGPLIILILGGSFVYALPYFRYYYYDAFLATFQINNTQMGNLQSLYGIFAITSYFPGGWLADRLSARKLLTFSLVGTGVLGLWLWTIPSYEMTLFIHGAWGVTSILTFWPAMIKAVRMLAAANEQGKAFGFMESGRGISNALHMSAAVAIFGYFSKTASEMAGLKGVMMTYSIACILVGVLIFLMLKDNEKEISQKGSSKEALLKVLKMPHTWLIVVIMFCSYSMNMSFYYITPYSTQIFKASAVFGAAIGVLSQYVRPVGSAGAGILGDIFNSSKIIVIGFILMIAGLVGLILVPSEGGMTMVVLIGSSVFIYISMYAIQALHYALLEEGDYPLAISGTAVGVVATLGYLPEVVAPQIAGRILDAYPGAQGFHYFFMVLIAFAVIGLITTFVWMGMTKEKRAALLAMKKEKLTETKSEV